MRILENVPFNNNRKLKKGISMNKQEQQNAHWMNDVLAYFNQPLYGCAITCPFCQTTTTTTEAAPLSEARKKPVDL